MSRPTIRSLQDFPDRVKFEPQPGGFATNPRMSGPVLATDPRPQVALRVRLILPPVVNFMFDNGQKTKEVLFSAPRDDAFLEVEWSLGSSAPPNVLKFVLQVEIFYADNPELNDVKPKLIWTST